jgi:hypothetical protein
MGWESCIQIYSRLMKTSAAMVTIQKSLVSVPAFPRPDTPAARSPTLRLGAFGKVRPGGFGEYPAGVKERSDYLEHKYQDTHLSRSQDELRLSAMSISVRGSPSVAA